MGSLATLVLWLVVAADPDQVDAALRRVLEADEYQTELPRSRPREILPPTPRTRDIERGGGPRRRPPTDERRAAPERATERAPSGQSDGIGPIGSVLFWILVAVFASAAAVYVLRDFHARQRAKAALGEAAKAAKAPAAAAPAWIPEHERLALAGRHVEAIHAILLEALAAIGAARAGLRPAWTSREILSLVKLEEAAHAALRSLVGLVEVTRFGGAPARETEYKSAVAWLGTIGGTAR